MRLRFKKIGSIEDWSVLRRREGSRIEAMLRGLQVGWNGDHSPALGGMGWVVSGRLRTERVRQACFKYTFVRYSW